MIKIKKPNLCCFLAGGFVAGVLTAQAGTPLAFYPAPQPGAFHWTSEPHSAEVGNAALAMAWDFSSGIRLDSLENRYTQIRTSIDVPLFVLHYSVDGKPAVLNSGKCPVSDRSIAVRNGQPDASRFAERLPSQQLVVVLENDDLSAQVLIDAGEGANYVRELIHFKAKRKVLIDRIDFFLGLDKAWKLDGAVRGVPLVKGDCFLSSEHPSSVLNKEDHGQNLGLGFALEKGAAWRTSTVVGVTPVDQLRRGFLYYVERERAAPFHVFQHYNNWTVTCYESHPYDEATVRNTIENWGEKFIQPYGVKIDSFALDDGWDDFENSMWQFHKARFPNGFKPFKPLLKKYNTSLGIWLSPAGGYVEQGKARRKYAREHGLANAEGKLSLAFPPYYDYFHKTISGILVEQDVNYFKIDKLGGVAELNGAKRIFEDLRTIRPDVFINLTRDSWPSPFWLRIADSLWRGGSDTRFADVPGSKTRQWIAFRDGNVHQRVVRKSPLYPISSLMVHGLILAKLGHAEEFMDQTDDDFMDQAKSFFGSGINCQELYIDYSLMNEKRWEMLAKLMKWSRANQEIFADVHWVGGDPLKAEIYGWAAWSPEKSILTLRNPSDQPVAFSLNPRAVFELPVAEKGTLNMKRLWAKDTFECPTDQTINLLIPPMQTLIWEGSFQ